MTVIMEMCGRRHCRFVLHISVGMIVCMVMMMVMMMRRGVATAPTVHGRPHGRRHVGVHAETIRRCPPKRGITML